MPPAISIITPTWQREALLQRQHQTVLRQSEQDFEWLILDDSPEPSAYFRGLDDPRIRYAHHAGDRVTIGAKRNWLAERASAPIIAHFDDDDYYAPDYLSAMLARMAERGADIVKLSGWFLYSVPHRKLAYWDTVQIPGLHFRYSPAPIEAVMLGEDQIKMFAPIPYGFGFSYVYRKSVWEASPYPRQNFAEDYAFMTAALAAGCRLDHFADTQALCLHILHQSNTSICFPQYQFPDFLLARLFPPDVENLLRP